MRLLSVFRQLRLSRGLSMAIRSPRVLSIQSHVVSGYVGNKSATFPLQVLGFEVDAINSVQFSNHTGYGSWTGDVISEESLESLMKGLAQNNLDRNYTHLLTGYARSAEFLKSVATIIKELRAKNKDLIYVCDPVMGDDGQLYVPAEVLNVYRDRIIPLADIITPNQFELELLTENKLHTVADVLSAIQSLHQRGCKTVVMTSSDIGHVDYLTCISSTEQGGKTESFKLCFPRFKASFTGTGDLFAALLLAWLYRSNCLKEALELTVATLHSILERTLSSISGDLEVAGSFARELKLIQSKEDIEKPKVLHFAEPISLKSS